MYDLLSGIQMIYQNETGKKLTKGTEEGRCRICGGPLLGKTVVSLKHLSGSWTDENIIADPGSKYLCEACAWLTVGKDENGERVQNKSMIWHGKPAMIVESDKTRTVEYYDFLEILRNKDFTYPVLFAVHGKHQKATQKHIQWKSNRCISKSPEHIRVAMSDMFVFDTGNCSMLDGMAQFSLDPWLEFTEKLANKAKNEILPYLPDKFTDRTKAHSLITMFLNVIDSARQLNEASYLSAYLAGYSLFPDLGKEAQNA